MQVPSYKRQAQLAPLPGYQQNVRVGADVFGAGVGEGIAQATRGIGAAVARVSRDNDEADEAQAKKAFNNVLEGEQQLLLDPQEGLASKQGENALTQSESFKSFFGAVGEKARAGLKNDRQRQVFEALWQREKLAFDQKVDVHTGHQAKAFYESEHAALVSNLTKKTVDASAVGSWDEVQDTIGLMAQAVEQNDMRNGLGPEARAANRRAIVTGTHVRVLGSMLERGQAFEAHEYLTTIKSMRNHLDGDVLAKSQIEGAVQEARYAGTGKALAQGTVRDASATVIRSWDKTQSPIQHVDESVVMARLAEIEADDSLPVAVKAAARDNAEELVKASRQVWKSTLDDTYSRAITKLQSNGWKLSTLAEEKAFLLSQKVDGGEVWRNIIRTRDNALHESQNGPATAAQREAMVRFLFTYPQRQSDYLVQDDKTFMAEWGPQLTPSDMKNAAGLVSRTGVVANRPDETLPASVIKRIESAMGPSGFNVWGPRGPKTDEDNTRFLNIFNDLLEKQAEAKRQGKRLEEDAIERVLNYWGEPTTVKGAGWFGRDKTGVPRVEAVTRYPGRPIVGEGDQEFANTLDNIARVTGGAPATNTQPKAQAVPEASRPQIIESFQKKHGRAPTDAEMAVIYERARAAGRVK